eukprot:scaffold719_cov359-Prasinococcus_capsulatus_cf.AAC.6
MAGAPSPSQTSQAEAAAWGRRIDSGALYSVLPRSCQASCTRPTSSCSNLADALWPQQQEYITFADEARQVAEL